MYFNAYGTNVSKILHLIQTVYNIKLQVYMYYHIMHSVINHKCHSSTKMLFISLAAVYHIFWQCSLSIAIIIKKEYILQVKKIKSIIIIYRYNKNPTFFIYRYLNFLKNILVKKLKTYHSCPYFYYDNRVHHDINAFQISSNLMNLVSDSRRIGLPIKSV